jgi:hypothetical protein
LKIEVLFLYLDPDLNLATKINRYGSIFWCNPDQYSKHHFNNSDECGSLYVYVLSTEFNVAKTEGKNLTICPSNKMFFKAGLFTTIPMMI